MEKRISNMYSQDRFVIMSFLITFWVVLYYVTKMILIIEPDTEILIMTLGVGIVLCIFGTVSLMAVLAHLKENYRKLYKEDIHHLNVLKFKKMKG